MYITATIDEALLYTNWEEGPDGKKELGLIEIIGWDPRCFANFGTETLGVQRVLIDERAARKLGIIAPLSDFALKRHSQHHEVGYEIVPASPPINFSL